MKKLKESSEYIVTVYTKKDDSKLIGGYKDKETAIKIGKGFIKENPDYVEFEVDLYDGYNSETVYKEDKSKTMKKIIEIQEEVKIGEVILEKGDRIQIIEKNFVVGSFEVEGVVSEPVSRFTLERMEGEYQVPIGEVTMEIWDIDPDDGVFQGKCFVFSSTPITMRDLEDLADNFCYEVESTTMTGVSIDTCLWNNASLKR